jgi:subtilisin family serine protease
MARSGLVAAATLLIVLAAGGTASRSQTRPPAAGSLRPVPGELIVRFRRGTTGDERRDARGDADTTLDRPLRVPRAQLLDVEKGQSVRDAIRSLERNPDVLYAEPNGRLRVTELPNDPSFDQLWGLDNTGQTIAGDVGTPGADVNALEAWKVTTGSPDVLVAVTDTGVDRDHPDLADNAWTNPGEAGALKDNGIDDDGNGFVDDWRGWDFSDHANDPNDVYGHGTHVAGTIGAVGDNGIGVTGVNQRVSLVGVKVLGDGGFGSDADVADGFAYAGRIGAKVVNASLGGAGTAQVIDDAIEGAPNTLYVVAAGNDGANVDTSPQSPCSEPADNLICVAATTNRDQLAWFSNYGPSTVDLGAPGVNVLSTVPGGGYATHSGTSMATPHVTGAAALVAAAHPELSALDLKDRLLTGTQQIDSLAGLTVTGGRLDTAAALGALANPPPVPALAIAPARPRVQESVTLDASKSTDDGRIAGFQWDLDGDGTYETSSGGNATTRAAFDTAGDREVGVRVRDNRGGTAATRLPLQVDPAGVDIPVARFEVPPAPLHRGTPIEFDASASTDDVGIVRYEWDFDGDWNYEVDAGTNPKNEHTFGSYTHPNVGLRVTDADGHASEVRRTVDIVPNAPTADFTVSPASPVAHQMVTFDAGPSRDTDGSLIWYRWDLDGDGAYETIGHAVVRHRYDSAGTVNVKLQVVDNDQQTGDTAKDLTVRPGVEIGAHGPPQLEERADDADGDGVVEPGEGVTLGQDLLNLGSGRLSGVNGTIRSLAPDDLQPGPSAGTWPDLEPGSFSSPSTLPTANTYGSAGCGNSLDLELALETDQGEATVPVHIPTTGHVGAKRTALDPYPYSLKPGWWAYMSFFVDIKGGIKHAAIRIDDLKHPDVGDLVLAAEPPGEYIFDDMVTLMDHRGGSGDDLRDTVFDSDADTSIADGEAPFTGEFRPEASLDGWLGLEARGYWGLYVENWSTTATAEINSIGTDVTPAECDDARNEDPTARFKLDGDAWYAVRGEPVTLDASESADPDGEIVEYRWDLDGDGTYDRRTASPRLVTTFAASGGQYVNLQVVDDGRAVTDYNGYVNVKASRPPTAAFTFEPDPAVVGTPMRFDALGSTDSDGEIVSYQWDTNSDGIYEMSGRSIEKVYSEPGWWAVTLRVVDDTGEEGLSFWAGEVVDPIAPGDPVDDPPSDPPSSEPPVDDPPPDDPPGEVQPPGGDPPISEFPPPPFKEPPRVISPPTRPPAKPPVLGLRAPAHVSRDQLRHGIPIDARCNPGCLVNVSLALTRNTARALHRARKQVVLGHWTSRIGPSDWSPRLHLPAKLRRALLRLGRGKLRLDVTASNAAGATSVARMLPFGKVHPRFPNRRLRGRVVELPAQ